MVGIAQFPGLGMYDEGGKFEVKQEFIDAARAKAIEEGKKYYGDATAFEKFKEGLFNMPDGFINYLAGSAEGISELGMGLFEATKKGLQIQSFPTSKIANPDQRNISKSSPDYSPFSDEFQDLLDQPAFTKYMGEFRGKIPRPNLVEEKLSGLSMDDFGEKIGYYTGPATGVVAAPMAIAKYGKEVIENAPRGIDYLLSGGKPPFSLSAGGKKVNPNQSLFEQTTNIKPNEFLTTLKNLNIEKNPEILKDFANFYDNYLYALRQGDKTKRTVSRSKERIDKFRSTVGDKKYDELINAASDAGLIKIRDMGGLKSIKSAGDDFIKQNYRNMEVDELLALMQKDAEKYFFTNSVGERLTFQTPQALNEHALRLGIKRKDVSSRLISQKIFPVQKEFENLLKTKKIDVKDPIAVKKTFREAVEKVEGRSVDTMGDDFYEHLDSRRKSYNELGTEYNIASRDEITMYKGGEKYATKFLKYYQNKFDKTKSLKDVNESSQFRFFHNISRTTPDLDNPEAFFKSFSVKDIKPGGKLHEKYLKFEKIDQTRKSLQEDIKPVLDKIFTKVREGTKQEGKQAETSLQIAHKFITKGIGKYVDDAKYGTGADSAQIYLDISEYNAYIQSGLESQARKLYNKYLKEGLESDYLKLQEIDKAMQAIGVEGQIAKGQTIGKAMDFDTKLSRLMIEAMDAGYVTQKEVDIALEVAENLTKNQKEYMILFSEKAPFAKGGLVGIDYLTRPLREF